MSSGFRSLVAVLESGFESAGVVVGAVGFQLFRPGGCWGFGSRMDTTPFIFPDYEFAVRTAWHTAIERLEAEAVAVGAHGVVGVWVNQESSAAPAVTQLTLVGTAVRVPREAPLARPFLSLLTMDDTLKLLLRGWVPSCLAVGFSAIHVHGWAASALRQGNFLTNAEMAAPSAGMQLARERAEDDLRDWIGPGRAEGVVAATLTLNRYSQACGQNQGVLIEGQILGTGVVRYRAPAVPVAAVRNMARGRSQ